MFDYYYGIIDIEFWMNRHAGGPEVVAWIKKNVHPLDIVFRLARDYGIVLLNGGGFDAPNWSVRVSFANLDNHVYDDIGRAVREIALVYRDAYKASLAKAAERKQSCAGENGKKISKSGSSASTKVHTSKPGRGKTAKAGKPAASAKSTKARKRSGRT